MPCRRWTDAMAGIVQSPRGSDRTHALIASVVRVHIRSGVNYRRESSARVRDGRRISRMTSPRTPVFALISHLTSAAASVDVLMARLTSRRALMVALISAMTSRRALEIALVCEPNRCGHPLTRSRATLGTCIETNNAGKASAHSADPNLLTY